MAGGKTGPIGDFNPIEKFFDAVKEGIKNSGTLADNIERTESAARELNNTFGGARQRIQEIKIAVADATPGIDRLGGTMRDTVDVLKAVSEATRRNVIASTEDITGLFAASEVTGQQLSTLVENFTDVGIQFSRVGPEVEKSVNYIMSVGANTKQVFDTMMGSVDKLNQFSFQNGIQGLAKMATQASVLRFDMSQVFNLADKALDPQKAVELSSAFQRLGVSVGELTDPFQLMYKSLMDPEGLQQAIIDMSKEFTYFNEETKRFEITPQGKLMMREIESETGLAAREMSKLALNTAEVDRKLSMLKPEISFASEEDKLLFANIARMDASGKVVVDIQDSEGKKAVDVAELGNDKIQALIEIQKQAPKDLEEVQRRQLKTTDVIQSDVRAILQRATLGVVSAEKFMELQESLRATQIATTSTMERSMRGSGEAARKATQDALKGVGNMTEELTKLMTGQDTDIVSKVLESFGKMKTGIQENTGMIGSGTLDPLNLVAELKNFFKDKAKEFSLVRDATNPMSMSQLTDPNRKGYTETKEREISRTVLRLIDKASTKEEKEYMSFEADKIKNTTQVVTEAFVDAMKKGTINGKVDHNMKINDWNINIIGSAELSDVLKKQLKEYMGTDEMKKIIVTGVNQMLYGDDMIPPKRKLPQ